MVELAYAESRFRAPEIPHRYGPQVHLLDDPLAWSLLARACSPETGQPDAGRLIRTLYEMLARTVLAAADVSVSGGAGVGVHLTVEVRYHERTDLPLVGALFPDPELHARVVIRSER